MRRYDVLLRPPATAAALPLLFVPRRLYFGVVRDGHHRAVHVAVQPTVVGLTIMDVRTTMPQLLGEIVCAGIRVPLRQTTLCRRIPLVLCSVETRKQAIR